MSAEEALRRRGIQRAAVFAVLAAALMLIAVRSVGQREARLRAEIGPIARIVVLARDVPRDHTLRPEDLATQDVPLRWVPVRTLDDARNAVGLHTAVALERGTPLLEAVLTSPADRAQDALARGDRVLELVASGSGRLLRAGTRVDVVSSRAGSDGRARTVVVAADVELLDVRSLEDGDADGVGRVNVTVRVPQRAALALATAQDGDATLRLLPRAAWSREGLQRAP